MNVCMNTSGRNLIVSPNGEIDQHISNELRSKIDWEIRRSRPQNILFDFTNVSFMDSSGVGVLIGRYKNVKYTGGRAAATGLSGTVLKLYELAGLKKIIPCFDSADDAMTWLEGRDA